MCKIFKIFLDLDFKSGLFLYGVSVKVQLRLRYLPSNEYSSSGE